MFYVVIFIIAAFLAGCWIAFPFIVLSKFNELLKVTRQIRSVLNDSNKGLLYLVDSAGRATDFAVVIAYYQVGIHLGYFLSDQSELRRRCAVALVLEGH
jgi:hypothetical protein